MKASYEGGSRFTSWNVTSLLSSGIKLYRENLIHRVKLGWLRKFVVSDTITIFGQVRSQVFQIQLGYISSLDTISHTYIKHIKSRIQGFPPNALSTNLHKISAIPV